MTTRLIARTLMSAVLLTAGVFAAAPAASAAAQLPDISVPLPEGYFSDLVVDDAHERVFIAMRQPDVVLVVGFDGVVTDTITGFTTPWDLAIDDTGSTVYVSQGGFYERFGALGIIDTATLQAVNVAMPQDHCPEGVTFAGGKVWYSYLPCWGFYDEGALGSYDPATGTFASGPISGESGEIIALPGRPDRVVQLDEWTTSGQMHIFDVSSGAPVEVARGGGSFCRDAALIAGGDQVATGCAYYEPHHVYDTADLSETTPIDVGEASTPIASTPDGDVLAVVVDEYPHPNVVILDVAAGSPGDEIRRYGLPGWGPTILTYSLEFAADGTLFGATYNADGSLSLHVFRDATKPATSIAVDVPAQVSATGIVHATGRLHNGPGVATNLSLRRTDRSGTHDMGTIPVAADGSFRFDHDPALPGDTSYTLSWPGDAGHGRSTTTVTVFVEPLPFDVDGDGYADVVAGSPGEDIDDATDTGMFHLLSGGADGVTGKGSAAFDQTDTRWPGVNAAGDDLGRAGVSGDFDRDGYADVVVAMPGKDYVQQDAGGVLVFHGSAEGLLPENSYEFPLPDYYYGQSFARSLAVGDVNGDGHDDLAVGQPDQYSGAVDVFFGSAEGLRNIDWGEDYISLYQGENGVPGTATDGDGFGSALAAGDVNGDGLDDLAVATRTDCEDTGEPAGAVTVLYGSSSEPLSVGAQRFAVSTPDVPGAGGTFGHDLELADFDGDGLADLAAATPGAAVRGRAEAGSVTVLYSDGRRITTSGAFAITQATAGVPGAPAVGNRFGAAIATGDADRDGRAELAVHSPGDGRVTVIPGSPTGPDTGRAKAWTQNTPGIPGATEAGDLWGSSLRFTDVKGTGYQALLIGAYGENDGAGAFTVVYGGPAGLTAAGSRYFDQDSTGVPDTAENGDHFGVVG